MTSLSAQTTINYVVEFQSQNWEKCNFDPPYQKYFFYNSPFDMDRCGLHRCTAGAWAVFMHFRLPLYDKPFLKYRMSKANLLIFSNIFHFTFWPITFFPYKIAERDFTQWRSLTSPTICTRPLSPTMSGNLFFGASKQKWPFLGGKSIFFAPLRYATGFRLAIIELYSTRPIRQKKPEVPKWKIKGS